jgi:hypothetical protein
MCMHTRQSEQNTFSKKQTKTKVLVFQSSRPLSLALYLSLYLSLYLYLL